MLWPLLACGTTLHVHCTCTVDDVCMLRKVNNTGFFWSCDSKPGQGVDQMGAWAESQK